MNKYSAAGVRKEIWERILDRWPGQFDFYSATRKFYPPCEYFGDDDICLCLTRTNETHQSLGAGEDKNDITLPLICTFFILLRYHLLPQNASTDLRKVIQLTQSSAVWCRTLERYWELLTFNGSSFSSASRYNNLKEHFAQTDKDKITNLKAASLKAERQDQP